VICWSKGTAANIGPVTPPMTNVNRNPRMKSIGVRRSGRPAMIVAIQANTWIPLGMVIIRLAAEKNVRAMAGMPVANMWWTHTPNPTTAVAMVARASQG
jgi:hypothetical protein